MIEGLDSGVISRLDAFDKRHGACVQHDGWIRFIDGACRETNPLGLLIEPPANDYDRARRIAMYYKIKLHRAVRAFDSAKSSLRMHTQANMSNSLCGPAPDDNVVHELQGLQAKVNGAKRRYDAACREVERVKPQHLRDGERLDLENRQRNAVLLAKIDNITC